MPKTGRLPLVILRRLAWTALGAAGVGACSWWNLGYLDSGLPRDGGADSSTKGDGAAAADAGANEASAIDDAATDEAAPPSGDGGPAITIPDGGFPSCAALSVPLSSPGQTTEFTINLSSNFDFTRATISVALYAPNALGGSIEAYIQNNGNGFARQNLGPQPLSSFHSWTVYTWTVPSTFSSGFDVTKSYYLGLIVEAGSMQATYEQPDTLIYVGEIVAPGVVTPVGPFTFDSPTSLSDSPGSPLPGDTLWLNKYDAQIAGSDIVWESTCGVGAPHGGDAGSDAAADAQGDAPTDASAEASADASGDAADPVDAGDASQADGAGD